jgi:epoxyqueuosine reductase
VRKESVMNMTAEKVKDQAASLGCDLCGVASISRFKDIPALTNPKSILPEARSVIVIAVKFLYSTVDSGSTIPYTIIRNHLSHRVDRITIDLSYYLEEMGYFSIPTGAIDPCNYNKDISKKVGLISLKNAAYQAGLGTIGKNTLLITPKYGNMVWLGAIITSAELDPDPIVRKNPCKENCRICIQNCPVRAIDGSIYMDQKKCWDYAFGEEDGGEWRIKCFLCRSRCPYTRGYKE